jgi:hypothetical protein
MEPTVKSNGPRRRVYASTRVAKALGFLVKLGRAATVFTVLACLGLALIARSVRGEVGEKALGLGKDLAAFADLVSGSHQVMLNGETIYLSSTIADQDKREILDRFEAHCQEYSGGLFEEFAKLPKAKQDELAKKTPITWGMRFGMVRNENDDEGMIVCIAQNGGGGVAGVVERLTRLTETWDLAALGNLRYVFVRRIEDGRSHVLTSFTEGSFNLDRVLGLKGEAAGIDPPGAPRPPDSRRILSVSADGAPYGVQSFQSGASPTEIKKFYDDTMPKLGWEKVADDDEVYRTGIYQRGGVTMTISALQFEEGEKTTVTFAEGSPANPIPSFEAEVR